MDPSVTGAPARGNGLSGRRVDTVLWDGGLESAARRRGCAGCAAWPPAAAVLAFAVVHRRDV
ncbi:hypothetical protein HTZ77_35840 [Nonomuraea sp. SMC257]|uniref:Uncharacterized protein n=1 Tax=Nonomuraea montanisoli TaxID=2741721 RepID=A0A7Y6M7J0_9ACTN|nr:hypothetical protein [Nonomuraea montanisoli]NUW36740.1 hypothetical protein [Nonomuraea montanisoli]